VDTGRYIVEMTNASGDVVLASSSILYVGSGEILSTLLKMPSSHLTLGGLLGPSGTATLAAISSAAGVTAAAGSANTPAATPAGGPPPHPEPPPPGGISFWTYNPPSCQPTIHPKRAMNS